MRDYPYDNMLADKFEAVCKRLKKSGYDLSKIKIVMAGGHRGTYVTKRILQELEKEKEREYEKVNDTTNVGTDDGSSGTSET